MGKNRTKSAGTVLSISEVKTQSLLGAQDDSDCDVNNLIRDMMNLMLRSLNVRLDGTIGHQIIAQHAQRIAKAMKPLIKQRQGLMDHNSLKLLK